MTRQQLAYDLFVRPALDEAAARHNRPALNSAAGEAVAISSATVREE